MEFDGSGILMIKMFVYETCVLNYTKYQCCDVIVDTQQQILRSGMIGHTLLFYHYKQILFMAQNISAFIANAQIIIFFLLFTCTALYCVLLYVTSFYLCYLCMVCGHFFSLKLVTTNPIQSANSVQLLQAAGTIQSAAQRAHWTN